MGKILTFLIVCATVALISTPHISAQQPNEVDINDFEHEINDFINAIPDEIEQYFPYTDSASDPGEQLESIIDASEPTKILGSMFDIFKLKLTSSIKLFATILGLIALSAILNAVRESFSGGKISDAILLCIDISMVSAFVYNGVYYIDNAIGFLDSINAFISGIIPTTAALYVAGGNINAAAASSTGLMLFLGVCNTFCTFLLKAVCSVSIALSLCTAIAPTLKLNSLSAFIKKTFTISISFIMMIMVFIVTARSTFASARDNAASRTLKFFVGNMVPIVGGAVGDTIKILSNNIAFIRKALGIAAILIIIFMLVPHFIDLLVKRAVMLLCASIAEILDCSRQSALLKDVSNTYGNIIAVTSMVSVAFIIILGCFAFGTVAIGGID